MESLRINYLDLSDTLRRGSRLIARRLASRFRRYSAFPTVGRTLDTSVAENILELITEDPAGKRRTIQDSFDILENLGFSHLWLPSLAIYFSGPGRFVTHYESVFSYLESCSMFQSHISEVVKKSIGPATGAYVDTLDPFHLYLHPYKEHVTHMPFIGALGYLLMGQPTFGAASKPHRSRFELVPFNDIVECYRRSLRRWRDGGDKFVEELTALGLDVDVLLNRSSDALSEVIFAAWWVAALCHDIGNIYEFPVRGNMTAATMHYLLSWGTKAPSPRIRGRLQKLLRNMRDFIGGPYSYQLKSEDLKRILSSDHGAKLKQKRHALLSVHYILEKSEQAAMLYAPNPEWFLVIAIAARAILFHDNGVFTSKRGRAAEDLSPIGCSYGRRSRIAPRDLRSYREPLDDLLFLVDQILIMEKGALKIVLNPPRIHFQVNTKFRVMRLSWRRKADRQLYVRYGKSLFVKSPAEKVTKVGDKVNAMMPLGIEIV